MKLKNKKTGEIIHTLCQESSTGIAFGVDHHDGNPTMVYYNSLAEINEEWEDYKENEYYYAITGIKADDGITKMKNEHNDMTAFYKSIGNYFETKEEAEKAVEKLKVWKRLRDKGFRFLDHMDSDSGQGMARYEWNGYIDGEDLDLLFGGEDE